MGGPNCPCSRELHPGTMTAMLVKLMTHGGQDPIGGKKSVREKILYWVFRAWIMLIKLSLEVDIGERISNSVVPPYIITPRKKNHSDTLL